MMPILGIPMIARVWRSCLVTAIPTLIATDDRQVLIYMRALGAWAELVEDCETGSDRCAKAVEQLDIKSEMVINVQSDIPFIPPDFIANAAFALDRSVDAKWATIWAWNGGTGLLTDGSFHRVQYKSHIGVYAFRRETLLTFHKLKRTEREINWGLEQLRLVDNNIPGAFHEVSFWPLEVNTPEDLAKVNSCH